MDGEDQGLDRGGDGADDETALAQGVAAVDMGL